jgi:hypothetical protein
MQDLRQPEPENRWPQQTRSSLEVVTSGLLLFQGAVVEFEVKAVAGG